MATRIENNTKLTWRAVLVYGLPVLLALGVAGAYYYTKCPRTIVKDKPVVRRQYGLMHHFLENEVVDGKGISRVVASDALLVGFNATSSGFLVYTGLDRLLFDVTVTMTAGPAGKGDELGPWTAHIYKNNSTVVGCHHTWSWRPAEISRTTIVVPCILELSPGDRVSLAVYHMIHKNHFYTSADSLSIKAIAL